MKIIFLDIDGVLNTRNHIRNRLLRPEGEQGTQEEWCPVACENINKLGRAIPGRVGIVISSSWRIGEPILKLRKLLEKNDIDVELIDKTPHLGHDYSRGAEIKEWLESAPRIHSIENYLILDDGCDFFTNQLTNLIQCEPYRGFADSEKFIKAINVLAR